jgi:hypothetical protein
MISIATARWLLVAHVILGVAAVAAATHWVVWLWPWRRGTYSRVRATKRFGVITMAIYVAALGAGAVFYPTYKTHVKLEYLTSTTAVIEDRSARLGATEQLLARWESRDQREIPRIVVHSITNDEIDRAAKIARWFDVKEHWVALGLVLGLATMAVLLAWSPREDGRGPFAFVFLGAVATAAVVWLAAIVGLLTTATRSF